MKAILSPPRIARCGPTRRIAGGSWQPPSATQHLYSSRFRTSPDPSPTSTQVMPRGAYYDILLTNPPPYAATEIDGSPMTVQVNSVAEPVPESTTVPGNITPSGTFIPSEAPATINARKAARTQEAEARARIVFGSRLAGPIERENRLAEIRQRSTRVAGVLVPPKPTEPDNCCMSGCVNCVWDRYRDEMEEWAAASAEASRRLKAQEAGAAAAEMAATPASSSTISSPPRTSDVSMDDDGGGSDSNWSFNEAVKSVGDRSLSDTKGGSWEDELYKNIPVGIREFMKQEKRLKLKHMQEDSQGE